MSYIVLIENVTLAVLAVSALLSSIYRIEIKRNVVLCLFFYIGLGVQYFLKEYNLKDYWEIIYGSMFFAVALIVLFIKFHKTSLSDVLILVILSMGVARNLIMYYEYYHMHSMSFMPVYASSGLFFDAVLVLIVFYPLGKISIKKMMKWRGIQYVRRWFTNFA